MTVTATANAFAVADQVKSHSWPPVLRAMIGRYLG
jgi:hypothetical protein